MFSSARQALCATLSGVQNLRILASTALPPECWKMLMLNVIQIHGGNRGKLSVVHATGYSVLPWMQDF